MVYTLAFTCDVTYLFIVIHQSLVINVFPVFWTDNELRLHCLCYLRVHTGGDPVNVLLA